MSTGSPRRNAIDGVEPFLIRPAEVVDEGLPKMIAVSQRLTGNLRHAGVNGFDLGTKRGIGAVTFELLAEFRLQQSINLFCLRPAASSFYRLRSFLQEANALIARPGLHPCESAIDQTYGRQAVKRRIDPAVQWHIRRALIRGGGTSLAAKELSDRSPFPAAEMGIVMTAVNVLRDKVADHGTNDHVRRKMLVRSHARKTNHGSQTIREYFWEQSWILVCDKYGNGPCCGHVLIRKRCAASLKKRPACVDLGRPLAPQRVFE